MAEDKITILIDLDDKDVKKAFATITRQGKKTGDDVGRTLGNRLKGAFSSAGVGLKKFGSALGGLKSIAVGIGAALVGGLAIREFIEAAKKQEDAVNKLNIALAQTGIYSERASAGFQAFASSIQQSTKFGDEAILENAALLQTLGGLSEDGLKRATLAAVDMSAAIGRDLRTSMELLGKAASGEVGSLSRYGIIVKRGADNAETFERVLSVLESKFGGAATQQIRTFAGATEQASNNFGDLKEQLGFVITQSPVVITLVNSLSAAITNTSNRIEKLRSTSDVMGNIIRSIIQLGLSINSFVITPLEALAGAIKILFVGLETLGQSLLFAFAKVAQGIGFLGNAIGITSDAAKASLDTFAESTSDVLSSFDKSFFETLRTAFNFDMSETTETFLLNVDKMVSAANGSLVPAFKNAAQSTQASLSAIEISQKKLLATTQKIIGGALVALISDAFQRMGATIVSGASAWDTLKSTVLNILGDMMIQIGVAILGISIAVTALAVAISSLLGPIGIAAALVLIAAGGALKAAAGASLMSAATGGAGGGAGASPAPGDLAGGTQDDLSGLPEESDRQQPGTVVNVNVQGSIFDTTDTPRRLVELINEEFETKGTRFVRGIA